MRIEVGATADFAVSSVVLGLPRGMPAFKAGTPEAEDKETSVDLLREDSSTTSLDFRFVGRDDWITGGLAGDRCGMIAGDAAFAAIDDEEPDFKNLLLMAASLSMRQN